MRKLCKKEEKYLDRVSDIISEMKKRSIKDPRLNLSVWETDIDKYTLKVSKVRFKKFISDINKKYKKGEKKNDK